MPKLYIYPFLNLFGHGHTPIWPNLPNNVTFIVVGMVYWNFNSWVVENPITRIRKPSTLYVCLKMVHTPVRGNSKRKNNHKQILGVHRFGWSISSHQPQKIDHSRPLRTKRSPILSYLPQSKSHHSSDVVKKRLCSNLSRNITILPPLHGNPQYDRKATYHYFSRNLLLYLCNGL